MNKNFVYAMADLVHPYFTASPHFPDEPEKAWDDGKQKFIKQLQLKIEAIEQLTLDDYCIKTGSTINQK